MTVKSIVAYIFYGFENNTQKLKCSKKGLSSTVVVYQIYHESFQVSNCCVYNQNNREKKKISILQKEFHVVKHFIAH